MYEALDTPPCPVQEGVELRTLLELRGVLLPKAPGGQAAAGASSSSSTLVAQAMAKASPAAGGGPTFQVRITKPEPDSKLGNSKRPPCHWSRS